MKTINLCGNDWQLIYVKNEHFKAAGCPITEGELLSLGTSVPASVPGNFEIDLMRAGKIEDPFYADNHSKRELEYMHAFYIKKFSVSEPLYKPYILFEGLDTVADIYLNGCKIGSTDNMLIPHKIELADALRVGENTLLVHIKPAVLEARKYMGTLGEDAQIYNIEALHIRKAAHTYGWDIMPRIVSLGIWRPVSIFESKKESITEFYCYTTRCNEKEASLYFHCNVDIARDECEGYALKINGSCGDSQFTFVKDLWYVSTKGQIKVNSPKLWWPKNSGEPNLYDVTVTLLYHGEVIDEYKTRLGIRTVVLERTSVVEGDNAKFGFIVNGKRVFCLGTNWVPVDALHSRDRKRLPDILPMLSDIGCNTVRVWGGSVYEDELFYEFCDENGIMVWQDFMFGCGAYPIDREFCGRVEVEITSVVKRLRQHPCIILWAGDNENDIALTWHGMYPRDPNGNILTRELIPRVLRMHDYVRPYLPSSPYIDEVAYATHAKPTEDHLWGPRDYFKGDFYRNSVCAFASETGYHGCNSPKSIAKFIPEEYIWTAENGENWQGIDNPMWLYHAASPELSSPYTYRIRLMANQVTTLFGKTVPCTLADFARASQISQAEAKKYFIERFRLTKWRRTGIIWWNLVDGWPQFSDAVVDYYGIKKLAYSYIKRSQAPVAMMFDEPKNSVLSLYAVNEYPENREISYTVHDLTVNKTVLCGNVTAVAQSSVRVGDVKIEADEKHFYYIEWDCGGERGSNHYMTNIRDIDYGTYLGYIRSVGYDSFTGF